MSKSPPPQNTDTFHKARSRLIEAFARLENRAVISLGRAGLPVKGDTLASKLKSLREASKGQTELFERLGQLTQLRADIVHGAMVLIDVDGERFASFRNAKDALNEVQRPSQFTYKVLKEIAEEIDQHSAQLAELKF